VPCPTEMPPRSAALATPPSDAWLPRTTTAVVDHGSRQETQTGHPNVRVGTTQRSIAVMASAWLRRNVRHVCDGGPRCLIMYLETVDSASSKPSLRSSPWMRGANPQPGAGTLTQRHNVHRYKTPRPHSKPRQKTGGPAAFSQLGYRDLPMSLQ
jgi:hypothetical protein